jgi:hypothetical protein
MGKRGQRGPPQIIVQSRLDATHNFADHTTAVLLEANLIGVSIARFARDLCTGGGCRLFHFPEM